MMILIQTGSLLVVVQCSKRKLPSANPTLAASTFLPSKIQIKSHTSKKKVEKIAKGYSSHPA